MSKFLFEEFCSHRLRDILAAQFHRNSLRSFTGSTSAIGSWRTHAYQIMCFKGYEFVDLKDYKFGVL